MKKREYSAPLLEIICLDNEISLVLASDPPIFPGEESNNTSPDYNIDNSFKSWFT